MLCSAKKYKGKKFLITGGTGFIGKRVVEYLKDTEAMCYVITRKYYEDTANIKYIQCDLNDMDTLDIESLTKEGLFDAIIYLAANIPEIGMKKENYYDAKCSTFDPIIHFVNKTLDYCERFIYASSIDVIGTPQNLDYTEEEPANPATPYALAKYCGEMYVQKMCELANRPLVNLRFSQVYGPKEPLVRVIPILLNTIKQNGVFNKFTTGEEKRRFLYVDDAVQSIILAIDTECFGTYNIAGKSVDTVNDLLDYAGCVYEKEIATSIVAEVKAAHNVPNIDKAIYNLGYNPKYSLLEGIRKIREVEENGK